MYEILWDNLGKTATKDLLTDSERFGCSSKHTKIPTKSVHGKCCFLARQIYSYANKTPLPLRPNHASLLYIVMECVNNKLCMISKIVVRKKNLMFLLFQVLSVLLFDKMTGESGQNLNNISDNLEILHNNLLLSK